MRTGHATVAGSESQAAALWLLREGVAGALVNVRPAPNSHGGPDRPARGGLSQHATCRFHPPSYLGGFQSTAQAGAVYKYDISIPLAGMYDMVTDLRNRLVTIKSLFSISGKKTNSCHGRPVIQAE